MTSLAPVGVFSLERAATREAYAACALSSSSQRAYRRWWAEFEAFCKQSGCASLPARPEVVADFLIAVAERGLSRSSLVQARAAIAHEHGRSGLGSPGSHPQVRQVVAGLLRRFARPSSGAEPLLPSDVHRLIARLKPGLQGLRDLALITFGVAGGFRRSELSSLRFSDVRIGREDVLVLLPRSKTDKTGVGHERRICAGERAATCPVSALRLWVRAAAIEDGWLFRPIKQLRGRELVLEQPLSSRRIDEIVREYTRRLLQDDPDALPPGRYSAHSLRAGAITGAVLAGKAEHEVREHVGHASANTTARYVRATKRRTSEVTKGIGL